MKMYQRSRWIFYSRVFYLVFKKSNVIAYIISFYSWIMSNSIESCIVVMPSIHRHVTESSTREFSRNITIKPNQVLMPLLLLSSYRIIVFFILLYIWLLNKKQHDQEIQFGFRSTLAAVIIILLLYS